MYASTKVTNGRAALNPERPLMQAGSSPRCHRGLPQGGAPPATLPSVIFPIAANVISFLRLCTKFSGLVLRGLELRLESFHLCGQLFCLQALLFRLQSLLSQGG
jgi:hypothetical protein